MLLQLTSLLAVLTTVQAGFYGPTTPVLELDSSNFDSVVLNTNQTSIVEFYAPWCGHCRNLQPEYVRTGRLLQEMAVVGAVNCDESKNKPLCSKYRVEGFPTLIVFRPPKYSLDKKDQREYVHATEIYSGPRKTKSMVDFVTDRMKNYTKRFATLGKLETWASNDTGRLKVVVFTKKDRLSAFLKSLAIDFLGKVDFGYLPLKNGKDDVFEKFGIDREKSSLAVYSDDNWTVYDGELTKQGITEFLAQYTNVDEVKERSSFLKAIMNGEKPKKKAKKGKNSKTKKSKRDEL